MRHFMHLKKQALIRLPHPHFQSPGRYLPASTACEKCGGDVGGQVDAPPESCVGLGVMGCDCVCPCGCAGAGCGCDCEMVVIGIEVSCDGASCDSA